MVGDSQQHSVAAAHPRRAANSLPNTDTGDQHRPDAASSTGHGHPGLSRPTTRSRLLRASGRTHGPRSGGTLEQGGPASGDGGQQRDARATDGSRGGSRPPTIANPNDDQAQDSTRAHQSSEARKARAARGGRVAVRHHAGSVEQTGTGGCQGSSVRNTDRGGREGQTVVQYLGNVHVQQQQECLNAGPSERSQQHEADKSSRDASASKERTGCDQEPHPLPGFVVAGPEAGTSTRAQHGELGELPESGEERKRRMARERQRRHRERLRAPGLSAQSPNTAAEQGGVGPHNQPNEASSPNRREGSEQPTSFSWPSGEVVSVHGVDIGNHQKAASGTANSTPLLNEDRLMGVQGDDQFSSSPAVQSKLSNAIIQLASTGSPSQSLPTATSQMDVGLRGSDLDTRLEGHPRHEAAREQRGRQSLPNTRRVQTPMTAARDAMRVASYRSASERRPPVARTELRLRFQKDVQSDSRLRQAGQVPSLPPRPIGRNEEGDLSGARSPAVDKGVSEIRIVQDTHGHPGKNSTQLSPTDVSESILQSQLPQMTCDDTRAGKNHFPETRSQVQGRMLVAQQAREDAQLQRPTGKQPQTAQNLPQTPLSRRHRHLQQSQQLARERVAHQACNDTEFNQKFSNGKEQPGPSENAAMQLSQSASHVQTASLPQQIHVEHIRQHEPEEHHNLTGQARDQANEHRQLSQHERGSREAQDVQDLNDSHFLAQLEQHDSNVASARQHREQVHETQQPDRSDPQILLQDRSLQSRENIQASQTRGQQHGSLFNEGQCKVDRVNARTQNSNEFLQSESHEQLVQLQFDHHNELIQSRNAQHRALRNDVPQRLRKYSEKDGRQDHDVSFDIGPHHLPAHEEEHSRHELLDRQQQAFLGDDQGNLSHQKAPWSINMHMVLNSNVHDSQGNRQQTGGIPVEREAPSGFVASQSGALHPMFSEQIRSHVYRKQTVGPSLPSSSNAESLAHSMAFQSAQDSAYRPAAELTMPLTMGAGAQGKDSPLQPPQPPPPAWATSSTVNHPATSSSLRDLTQSPQLQTLAFSSSLRNQASPASFPGLRDGFMMHTGNVNGHTSNEDAADAALGAIPVEGQSLTPGFNELDDRTGPSDTKESAEQRKRRLARERQRRRRKRLRGDAGFSEDVALSESEVTPPGGNTMGSLSEQPIMQISDVDVSSRQLPSSTVQMRAQGVEVGKSRGRLSLGVNVSADAASREMQRLDVRIEHSRQGVARPPQAPSSSPRAPPFTFRSDFNPELDLPAQGPEAAGSSTRHDLQESLREQAENEFESDHRFGVGSGSLRSPFASRMGEGLPGGAGGAAPSQIGGPAAAWPGGPATSAGLGSSELMPVDASPVAGEGMETCRAESANESVEARKRRLARDRQRKRRDRMRCSTAAEHLLKSERAVSRPRVVEETLSEDGMEAVAGGIVEGGEDVNRSKSRALVGASAGDHANVVQYGGAAHVVVGGGSGGGGNQGMRWARQGGREGLQLVSAMDHRARGEHDGRGVYFTSAGGGGGGGGGGGVGGEAGVVSNDVARAGRRGVIPDQATWQQGFASEAQARFAVEDASRVLRTHLEGLAGAQRPYVLQQSLFALAASDRYLRDLLDRGSTL